MYSNKKTGRISGVLLLFTFIAGIITFQFLQNPVLSSKDFAVAALENENKLIFSTIFIYLFVYYLYYCYYLSRILV